MTGIERSATVEDRGAPAAARPIVVAFSFARRPDDAEPNPCNVALGRVVADLTRGPHRPYVVAQWEIAKYLSQVGVRADLVVMPRLGEYLSSQDVWGEAARFSAHIGAGPVLPVAQPYLHLSRVIAMIKRSGHSVQRVEVPPIGFDPSPSNGQWWTRGPVRLTIYAAQQAVSELTRRVGRAFRVR